MKLSQMFENAPGIEIAGLCIDSRCAKADGMYLCMEGMVHDRHEFIDDVIEKGVEYIVHSRPVDDMKKGVTYIRVENVNRMLNRVTSMFYGHPSHKMKVFGVTGTSRKSIIASIIRDVCSHFAPCGYIRTVSISYGEMTLPLSSTTPDAVLIHKTMKDMVEHGIQAVALKVSSHGLELGRMQSVDSDVAVFSGLTYDHLDFHDTIGHYFETKKELFTNLKKEDVAVLNADDAYVDQLADAAETSAATYSVDNHATCQTENIRIERAGSRFTLVHGAGRYEVSTNLVALYSIYSLLGAVTAMAESGTPTGQQLPYPHDIRQTEGRIERIDEGQLFNVIVDFAHTPDDIEKAFEYAKSITEDGHSIIVAFGSAGRRDTKKRRVFGGITSHYCDSIILMEDDPRDENPWEIANEIKGGISDTNDISIADRYAVIRQAIEGANVKGTVLTLDERDGVFMYREFGREPQMGDHNVARYYVRKYDLGLEDDEKQGYKIGMKEFSI